MRTVFFLLRYIPRLVWIKISSVFIKKNWRIKLLYKDKAIVFKNEKPGFWTDPFMFYDGTFIHVFFENYFYELGRGIISHVSVDENLALSNAYDVLTEPFHLSYPHIINMKGDLYMLPETREASQIRLYKCIEFPIKWDFCKVLIDKINAVDSTIYYYNGYYWLFCTIKTGILSNSSDALCLYYTDDVFNEWTPHAKNPIRLNCTSSRSAGAIYTENNKIYRPVQNGQFGYGHSIDIYEIIELTTMDYKDRFVEKLSPKKYHRTAIGMHTFNKVNDAVVIDIIS